MSRGERQESRGVEKIREIWKRKRVIELQKIEAVDEKRKRGTRKEGKAHRPEGLEEAGAWGWGKGLGVGQELGTRSFSPRSQTKSWEEQGQEHSDG